MGATAGDSISVREALARHYAAHGLPLDGGESERWFHVTIGPLTLRLPNPPARRRAVFFHDVNHVLTGYDTTFGRGEMAIAAFEIGTGCGPYAAAWLLNLGVLAFGLVARPRAVYDAFVRGRHTRSLYRLPADRSALGQTTVAELRSTLGIASGPVTPDWRDRAAFGMWSIVAAGILLLPAAAALIVGWQLLELLRR